MTLEQALESPRFSHARAKSWCGQWQVLVYHHNPESPSGVTLAASAPDDDVTEALFRKHGRPSPLSPTERR